MKNGRQGILRRLAAAAIAVLLLTGAFSVTKAEAAVGTPGNCRFARWNNSNCTSCDIYWNEVYGCDGYQSCLSLTNGTHPEYCYIENFYVGLRYSGLPRDHVTMIKVRAFVWRNGKRQYGPWSNLAFITPSPAKTTKNPYSIVNPKAKYPEVKLKWNIVYGCDGYNIFLTTNPNGTWRWNQSTAARATATSAVISKYSGGRLKTYTHYYYRIVTRRRRNGVFCTVPMPSSNYYTGRFIIRKD